ncbi:MAG: formate dehydrogenase accessory sulfurtransferase FdhD [Methanobacteriota archaeon]|nr:MAG: formate dehydrogenase accessory sulfurtransferase FdhD [Euryarchaeota archaeon]
MAENEQTTVRGDSCRLDIIRIDGRKAERTADIVSKELPVKILLNGTEIVTLMCTPKNLDCLAIGFLFAEGLLKGREEINAIRPDERDGAVWVETGDGTALPESLFARRLITSSGGKGVVSADIVERMEQAWVNSDLKISSESVSDLMEEFLRRSKAFELTGAVHSAALCRAQDILFYHEDIGRHNAIDKVIGESILKGVNTGDRMIVTSGRVSAEVLMKAARAGIPIIVSKSAPTDLAIRFANDTGITLVGFARGDRMNVYSNERRITTETPG